MPSRLSRFGGHSSSASERMKALSVIGLLILSSILGVLGATSVTCGVGLIQGTSTWCGFDLMLLVGAPIAIPVALVLGYPTYLIYRRWNLRRWWMFALSGLVLAAPIWYVLVSPIGANAGRWRKSMTA